MVDVRRDGVSVSPQWRFRPVASLNKTPAVTDTWYTLLDLTSDVYLVYLQVRQNNTAGGAKDITVKVTVDGTEIETVVSCASGTRIYITLDDDQDEFTATATKTSLCGDGMGLYGQSMKIEGKLTSDDPDVFRMWARWFTL